jgi:hypothetical protein
MSYFTGSSGSLNMDGNQIAAVQSWSVNASVSLLSVKSLAETDDRFIASGRTITGSCRILYYQETLGEKGTNDASAVLNRIFKARDTSGFYQGATLNQGSETDEERLTLRLKIDDSSTNGKYIELRVIITNVSMTMAVGEILAADISFQAHGAPTALDI